MNKAQITSVASLGVLGMLGGCMVIAFGGFTASGKYGSWEVFVPAPQGYIMAVIMFSFSVLAVVWLLQQAKARVAGYVMAAVAYVASSIILVRLLKEAFL
jgi:hypothetical protein